MNKTIFWSFGLAILCSACSLQTTKGLEEITPHPAYFRNAYFSDAEKDYVYQAKIEAYGNSFGGIFIVKKLHPEHHRIVFTSKFGHTIFDMELEGDACKINFIVEKLNKKLIINTLKKDFQLLVRENYTASKSFRSPTHYIYQAKQGKHSDFYFVQSETDLLDQIVHSSTWQEKRSIHFEANTPFFAKKISIQHLRIKLRLDLKAF